MFRVFEDDSFDQDDAEPYFSNPEVEIHNIYILINVQRQEFKP